MLERAGLIARGRSAQSRPSRIRLAPLEEAVGWVGETRATWEARMDRLDEHLKRIQEARPK